MPVQLFEAIHSATGALLAADEAPKGEGYQCPHCYEPVTLKRGVERRAHYAHKGTACGGALETYLHKSGIDAILDNQSGKLRLASGDWYVYVKGERKCTLVNRHPDAMLWAEDGTCLAIEICVTHPMPPEKRAELQALGIQVLEICLYDYHADLSFEELREAIINEIWNKEDVNIPAKPAYAQNQASFDWTTIFFVLAILMFVWTLYRYAKTKSH